MSSNTTPAGNTGARSVIFDRIDALSECETLPDAIRQMQAILSEMAYYVINSDGAILESQEEWHTEFTDRLLAGAGKDAKKKPSRAPQMRPSASSAESDPRPRPSGSKIGPKPQKRAAKVESPPPEEAPAGAGAENDEDIPASLLAIMKGTHPTLHQEDDNDFPRGYLSRSAGSRSTGQRSAGPRGGGLR